MAASPGILVLGVYPCAQPRHGGQIRLAEISRTYRAAGYAVCNVAAYDFAAYPAAGRGNVDIDFPWNAPAAAWRGQQNPHLAELALGRWLADSPEPYARISRFLTAETVAVHLEQPWLHPLVQRWRDDGKLAGRPVVYGSQNIEAPLKRAILENCALADVDCAAADIAALETAAAQECNLVVAVSQADRDELASRTTRPVVLAANGIAAWQPTESALAAWRERLPREPFALFIGSAHPPNIEGFFDVLGNALGFLPPDRKICVAGSVGRHLCAHPAYQRWRPLNDSRLIVLGELEDDDLAAVKALAHAFILPIAAGGGSNIKTAEAIYSGRHVVGTAMSFRGYEHLLPLRGVQQAASPADFRLRLADALRAPPLQPSESERNLRQSLLWQNTLHPLGDAFRGLLTC